MLRQELYIFKYIVPGCNIQFPFKYFSKYAFIIRIISSLKLSSIYFVKKVDALMVVICTSACLSSL